MFTIPSVFGLPINVWEGIVLIFLLAFQLVSGMRWLTVNPKYHKWNGIAIVAIAAIHAFLGLSVWVFGIAQY